MNKENGFLSRGWATKVILFAFVLDFMSTVILTPSMEENMLIRFFWERYGWFGLMTVNVFFGIAVFLIWDTCRLWLRKIAMNIISVSLLVLMGFKILIALTNYGLVPYYLTSWFQMV